MGSDAGSESAASSTGSRSSTPKGTRRKNRSSVSSLSTASEQGDSPKLSRPGPARSKSDLEQHQREVQGSQEVPRRSGSASLGESIDQVIEKGDLGLHNSQDSDSAKGSGPARNLGASVPLTKREKKHHRKRASHEKKRAKTPQEPIISEAQKTVQAFVEAGDLRGMKAFVHSGKDLSALSLPLNNLGHTALHVAAEFGQASIVEFLCTHSHGKKYKIPVDALDNNGWTPLLTAAAAGQLSCANLFIRHGADTTMCNDQGTTPLHYLVRIVPGPDTIIGEAGGFRVSRVKKITGEVPLTPEEEYIIMLNRAVADHGVRAINAVTTLGDTPLMNAALRKNIVAVRWLLARGADWRRRNNHGVTAVTYAEQTLDLSIMEAFVDTMITDVEKLPTTPDSRSEELRIFGSALVDLCEFEQRQRLRIFDSSGIERFVSELVAHSHVVSDFGGGDRVRLIASAVDSLMQAEKARREAEKVPRPITIPVLEDDGISAADQEAEVCNVPLCVSTLSRYLRRGKNLEQEGLFRVSPDQTELDSLTCRAELFGIHDVVVQNPSPISASALLKQYFRMMSEPVFPAALFQDLCDVGSDLSDDNEARAQRVLRELLLDDNRMPGAHRALLRYLLSFIQDVVEKESSNLMNVSNLAKMLGPVVIRPRVTGEADLLVAMKKAKQVNLVFQYIIEHEQELFDAK